MMADTNMNLKDIQQRPKTDYATRCSCHKCKDNLTFIVDRSDYAAFRIGLMSTVILAPFSLGYVALRKTKHKFQGVNSKKHKAASALWNAAQIRGNLKIDAITGERAFIVKKMGCPKAISIIAALFGGLSTGGGASAVAVICASESSGINEIKKKID